MYDNVSGIAAMWWVDQVEVVKMGRAGNLWSVDIASPWIELDIVTESSEFEVRFSKTPKDGAIFSAKVKCMFALNNVPNFWKQLRKPKIILILDQNDTYYMIGDIVGGAIAKDGQIKVAPLNSREVVFEFNSPYPPFQMVSNTVIANTSIFSDFSDDFNFDFL